MGDSSALEPVPSHVDGTIRAWRKRARISRVVDYSAFAASLSMVGFARS
ncbi:hypothetical protein GFS60_04582 [Rhodococcus sp. WAY2]|nr:hypothetical protein GFS60_04582 [Rhodococcus sp. WAY2]